MKAQVSKSSVSVNTYKPDKPNLRVLSMVTALLDLYDSRAFERIFWIIPPGNFPSLIGMDTKLTKA